MSITRTVFAAAALAFVALPASAASLEVSGMAPTLTGGIVKKAVVITVNQDEPAAALYGRINQAATLVCSSNPGGKSSLLTDKVEKCRVAAVRRAAREIGLPDVETAAR